jgi:hypothetical protein
MRKRRAVDLLLDPILHLVVFALVFALWIATLSESIEP